MNSRELIGAARVLTKSGRGRPAQARLRRAVSTAYYAMFHCMAASAADLFVGRTRGPAWHRAYRALEHRKARDACRRVQTMQEFPEEVRDFAKVFVALQIEREKADYALDTDAYRKSDVLGYIDSAKHAIGQFKQAGVNAKRDFAAHVLFKQRSSQGGSR